MNIRKIFNLIIATMTVLIVSCQKEDINTSSLPSGITQDLKFTKVEPSSVTYNSATIRVQHSGTSNDTWYGFVTDKVGTKDAVLISEKIKELTANGKITSLDKRTNARIELTGLKSATKYKYIVFAITESGQMYGTTKTIQFETEESAFLLTQCEDWTLQHNGRNIENNKETYSVIFNKTNAARCHVGFVKKSLVDQLSEEEDIKKEIEEYGGLRLDFGEDGVFLFSVLDYMVFQELYEYWGYYDSDEEYFTQETFSESYTFEIPRQASGEYYAVAIGFKDCEPTFFYSYDIVTIERESASSDYESWIGEWTATSANNITYNLKFEENDPNFSYFVYGWECSESVHNDNCDENCTEHLLNRDFSEFELGIPFYFDALTGKINILSMNLGVESSASGESTMYWGMFGFMEHEGDLVSILTQDDIIAEAAIPTSGQTTSLIGNESETYKIIDENNIETVEFTYKSLGYLMYENQTFATATWNTPMELPIAMTKLPASSNISMRKSAAESKLVEMKKNEIIKTLQTGSINRLEPSLLNR